LVLLVGLLLVLGAVPARAQTLDQSQLIGTNAPCLQAGANPISLAQTFTAGLTGDLVRVDLGIFDPAVATQPLTVEIRTVDAMGVPTATVLATETVPAADVPTAPLSPLTTVLINPPVAITATTQYAIVLYTAGTVPYCWRNAFAGLDPYAGGAAWVSPASPPTTWALVTPPGPGFDDFVFATYVDTTYTLPTPITNLAVSGSTLRFRLATAATVRFSLDKRVARNRFRRVGTFSARARRGRNRVRVPRRLNGRRVGKGVFRLSARAVNGGGRGALTRRVVRLR
jgi:hypothetical protein